MREVAEIGRKEVSLRRFQKIEWPGNVCIFHTVS